MVLNKDNLHYFRSNLDDLKRLNLYRRLRVRTRNKSKSSHSNDIDFIDFSTNDYLGLSKNKLLIKALKSTHLKSVSQCSSRLISGNSHSFETLEYSLANHRQTQAALVYPTGYMANIGAIGAIADSSTTIFSDELNHASIIDACRLTKSKLVIFSHNDIDDLYTKIKKISPRRGIIITEGIFSMNGDLAKLKEISEISSQYECMLVVDDAHGDFIIGNDSNNEYGGIASYCKVEKNVDLHISSMSKALGCFGGYVACSDLLRNYLINKSRAFIFTSALPEIYCELAYQSILLARKGDRQAKLYENLKFFNNEAQKYYLPGLRITNLSPIIPLIIGSEEKSMTVSELLFNEGYIVQPIRYPTVKQNEAQLRISISADHTSEQIKGLLVTINSLLN